MGPIQTFVFFDLETTGLPEYEYNKTKITELSMVAATRDHILNTRYDQLPRVLQKLSLCVYPKKMISLKSTEITGLSNDLLENQKPFSQSTVEIITLFLGELVKPICLVAHNGNAFDYPILQAELKRLQKHLPDDILCTDSLIAFKEFHENCLEPKCFNLGIVPLNKPLETMKPLGIDTTDNVNLDIISSQDIELIPDSQNTNETTPKHKRQTDNGVCNAKPSLNDTITPPSASKYKNGNKIPVARKKLCFASPRTRLSFKLQDVYRRVFNHIPKDTHRAECDVLLLLHCVVAYGEIFVSWADANSKQLSTIDSL